MGKVLEYVGVPVVPAESPSDDQRWRDVEYESDLLATRDKRKAEQTHHWILTSLRPGEARPASDIANAARRPLDEVLVALRVLVRARKLNQHGDKYSVAEG